MAKVAGDSRERQRYFAPFEENGVQYCGGCRRTCRKCNRKFKATDKFFLECPDCGEDRRCRRRSAGGVKCPKHIKRHLHVRGPLHPRSSGGFLAALKKSSVDLAARYARVRDAIDMRSVRDELAIVHTRIDMKCEGLTTDVTTKSWLELRKAVQEIELLMPRVQAGDSAAVKRQGQLLGDIFAAVRAGATEAENWQEVTELAELSAGLKSQEASIERDRKAYMTAPQVVGLADLFAMTVRDALSIIRIQWETFQQALDVEALRRVARDVAAKTGSAPEELERGLLEWRSTLPDASVRQAFPTATSMVVERIQTVAEH